MNDLSKKFKGRRIARNRPRFLAERLAGFDWVVGTVAGDVPGLLAPVTDFGLSSLVAVAADVSQAAAVVAFLSLAAVFRHVTEATAGVAGLATVVVSSARLATKSSTLTTAVATFIHGAIARNMANLATFVAIGTGTAHSTTLLAPGNAFLLRTLPRKMSRLAATITGLALGRFGTIAGKMSSLIAVVTDLASFGTITSLMTRFIAIVAGSTSATTKSTLESTTASAIITLSISVFHHSLLLLLFVRLVR